LLHFHIFDNISRLPLEQKVTEVKFG